MTDTDALTPVYEWLVTELGLPFEMCTREKPPWLDVRRLAECWRRHEGGEGETIEDYELSILGESGWGASAPHPECAASESGNCLHLTEGFEGCPDGECDREGSPS